MKDQNTETNARVKLIGIAGPKGSGKSTLAGEICHDCDYQAASFATPMKRMMEALGVPYSILGGDDELKKQSLPMLNGHSVRHALQTLGTEWGRTHMGEDFWIMQAMRGVDDTLAKIKSNEEHYEFIPPPLGIVFDDVRFDNEAQAIKSRGGIIVRIAGTHEAISDSHASERGVADFDFEITNEADPEDMLIDLTLEMANAGRRFNGR